MKTKKKFCKEDSQNKSQLVILPWESLINAFMYVPWQHALTNEM